MSDRTLSFYEDGPVEFTQEQFFEFSKLATGNNFGFDDMALLWPNHNYPDHIRRLCLRNILRQTNKLDAKLKKFSTTNYCFARLFYLLTDHYDLSTMLKLQPQLRQELAEELLYNLEHSIRRDISYSFHHDDLDRLILMLLPIVDEKTSHKLWRHHRYSQYQQNHIENLLMLCEQPMGVIPPWIRSQIETTIKQLIVQEIRDNLDFFKRVGCVGNTYLPNPADPATNRPSITSDVIRHIETTAYSLTSSREIITNSPSSSAYPTSTKNFNFSARLIHFLEKCVPEPLTYANTWRVISIILCLKDPDLTRKFARRHLFRPLNDSSLNDLRTPSGQITLYYIRGIVTSRTPKDTDFLGCLDSLITLTSTRPRR